MRVNAFALAADIISPPDWSPDKRPPLEDHQLPPSPPWTTWLLEAGRGSGKTESCARYFAKYMHEHPNSRGRIIAPTFGDAVESCILGPAGLRNQDSDVQWHPNAIGGSKVTWPNGSEALVLGTPFPKDVDRLRASGNRNIDWWEEMAANSQLISSNYTQSAWDQAQLGLRLGEHPHSIASTTPRSTTSYKHVRNSDGVVITHGTLFDNPHNPREWVEQMRRRYEHTRLGRQELHGELIEEVEGALWSHQILEPCRVSDHPDLAIVVVAIDPAATSRVTSDDTGIIVAGVGSDGHGYILSDRTCHLGPEGWGQRAVRAYRQYEADRIVAESNNGGEMVAHVIKTIDKNIPVKLVHASRGKLTRAEPVAALFGAPPKRPSQIHLVGGFPELEDQLCSWVPGEEDSPDRLDAMVWAISDMMLARQSSWKPL
jgi:phage terminase large subunit-like protein